MKGGIYIIEAVNLKNKKRLIHQIQAACYTDAKRYLRKFKKHLKDQDKFKDGRLKITLHKSPLNAWQNHELGLIQIND